MKNNNRWPLGLDPDDEAVIERLARRYARVPASTLIRRRDERDAVELMAAAVDPVRADEGEG